MKVVHFPSLMVNSHSAICPLICSNDTKIILRHFSSRKQFGDFEFRNNVQVVDMYVSDDISENFALWQFNNLERLALRGGSTIIAHRFKQLHNVRELCIDFNALSLLIPTDAKFSWFPSVQYLEMSTMNKCTDKIPRHFIRFHFPNAEAVKFPFPEISPHEKNLPLLPSCCKTAHTCPEFIGKSMMPNTLENLSLLLVSKPEDMLFVLPQLLSSSNLRLKILNLLFSLPQKLLVEPYIVKDDALNSILDLLISQIDLEVLSIRFAYEQHSLSPTFSYNHEEINNWACSDQARSCFRSHHSLKLFILGNQVCFVRENLTSNLMWTIDELDRKYYFSIRSYPDHPKKPCINFDFIAAC